MATAVKTGGMYRQVFVPDKQNNTVTIPSNLYGRKIEVIVLPEYIPNMQVSMQHPRKNWAEAAQQMHLADDDNLLIPTVLKNENTDWWQWKE